MTYGALIARSSNERWYWRGRGITGYSGYVEIERPYCRAILCQGAGRSLRQSYVDTVVFGSFRRPARYEGPVTSLRALASPIPMLAHVAIARLKAIDNEPGEQTIERGLHLIQDIAGLDYSVTNWHPIDIRPHNIGYFFERHVKGFVGGKDIGIEFRTYYLINKLVELARISNEPRQTSSSDLFGIQ